MLRCTGCAVLLTLGVLLVGVQPAAADTLVDNDNGGLLHALRRRDGRDAAGLQHRPPEPERARASPWTRATRRSWSPAPTTTAPRLAAARATSGRATTARRTAARPGAARSCPGIRMTPRRSARSRRPRAAARRPATRPRPSTAAGASISASSASTAPSRPTARSTSPATTKTAPTYRFTTRVERGTPSVAGLFQDKINITADQRNGNVYVAWARFSGNFGNDVIMFSRSTDSGRTYSKPVRISDGGA